MRGAVRMINSPIGSCSCVCSPVSLQYWRRGSAFVAYRVLFRILGMEVSCLAALSPSPPEARRGAPLARGVDGESAGRAIMAMPRMRYARNAPKQMRSAPARSTLELRPCNPSTTRSARGCHPCLRAEQGNVGSAPLTRTPDRFDQGGAPLGRQLTERRKMTVRRILIFCQITPGVRPVSH